MTGAELHKLYNARILELSAGLRQTPPLPDPQATVTLDSPLCGSRVRVDLRVENGRVSAYAHRVHACALGRSAAALLALGVEGRTEQELRRLRDRMEAMLKAGGPPPDGDWAGLAVLEPARDHPARHASVMLPFNAVVRAMDIIAGRCPPDPVP